MNWQKRLCGTVSGRMGIPIIDGPHPYFRKVKATEEEPILLTERKPSRAPPPPPPLRGGAQQTIEIDLNDAGVEILEAAGQVPQEQGVVRLPRTAPPPTGRTPPPPAAPQAAKAPQAQPGEEQRPSAESAAYSLGELLRISRGEKKPAPVVKPDTRPQESSVMRSMADLQEIERERIAEEAAASAQAAEDEQSLEKNIRLLVEGHRAEVEAEKHAREQSLAASLDAIHAIGREKADEETGPSLLEMYGGEPEGEAGREMTSQPQAQSGPSVLLDTEYVEPDVEVEEEKSISISIELLVGLPWEDQHTTYRMSDGEAQACEKVLPERAVMWLLPVPPRDSKDKGDIAVLGQFAKEARREFNGREYYIVEAPFAGAKRAARTGCLLHIWPESSTDYEFLGNVSGETDLGQPQTGEWSINMKAHILSQEELIKYSSLLPEGKPVFIHPVPEDKGQAELEGSLMESFKEGRIPRITLGKKEYFVMSIGTVAQWQETSFLFQNVRIASRKGEWLGIWPESETGREMMSHEYGFEYASHGPAGPPLQENGGLVQPYQTEANAIARLYGKGGEKRWLYPLPEKIGDMDSDTLNFLTVVSCRDIELNGISPLVSLQGRFYVSLKYAYMEAQPSSFENGAMRVHPKQVKLRDALAEVRQKAAERRAAKEKPMIVLPPDPKQRQPLVDMFPEGQTMYLYFVDPRNKGYVAMKPHVALMRGAEKEVYLVLKEPYEGAIAVRREGLAIYPLE